MLKAWKAEREKLTIEKNALYAEYYRLESDVKNGENIRRSVERLIRENGAVEKVKARGMEL